MAILSQHLRTGSLGASAKNGCLQNGDSMQRNSSWTVLKCDPKGFLTISQVERYVNGRKEVGFFKYATRAKQQKFIGPLIADELVGNRLATILNLPVARTELATIRGHVGIVSLKHPGQKLRRWNQLGKHIHSHIRTHIADSNRLYKTFVFDVWICNIDRNGKNIMTYRRGLTYDFYLIDHELSLLGALRFENKPWYSDYWNHIRRYTRGYNPALLPYITDYKQVAPYVRQIQHIRPETIRDAINRCPHYLLSKQDRTVMEKILFHRQRNLHRIVARCIATKP